MGTKSGPMRLDVLAYGVSKRRKSAVQNHWMSDSRMTVMPKVTSSEVNSVTRKQREHRVEPDAQREEQRAR